MAHWYELATFCYGDDFFTRCIFLDNRFMWYTTQDKLYIIMYGLSGGGHLKATRITVINHIMSIGDDAFLTRLAERLEQLPSQKRRGAAATVATLLRYAEAYGRRGAPVPDGARARLHAIDGRDTERATAAWEDMTATTKESSHLRQMRAMLSTALVALGRPLAAVAINPGLQDGGLVEISPFIALHRYLPLAVRRRIDTRYEVLLYVAVLFHALPSRMPGRQEMRATMLLIDTVVFKHAFPGGVWTSVDEVLRDLCMLRAVDWLAHWAAFLRAHYPPGSLQYCTFRLMLRALSRFHAQILHRGDAAAAPDIPTNHKIGDRGLCAEVRRLKELHVRSTDLVKDGPGCLATDAAPNRRGDPSPRPMPLPPLTTVSDGLLPTAKRTRDTPKTMRCAVLAPPEEEDGLADHLDQCASRLHERIQSAELTGNSWSAMQQLRLLHCWCCPPRDIGECASFLAPHRSDRCKSHVVVDRLKYLVKKKGQWAIMSSSSHHGSGMPEECADPAYGTAAVSSMGSLCSLTGLTPD